MAYTTNARPLRLDFKARRLTLRGAFDGSAEMRRELDRVLPKIRQKADGEKVTVHFIEGTCNGPGLDLWIDAVDRHLREVSLHYLDDMFCESLQAVGPLYPHKHSTFEITYDVEEPTDRSPPARPPLAVLASSGW